MTSGHIHQRRLRDFYWQYSYKTSSGGPHGKTVNILHDFYIPALKHSTRYDRVAGYFRSSSLAAASQGFSAFTEADGRMRLIVGADLDVEDVAAILHGDQNRMTRQLTKALGDPATWPVDVSRGVELLAWMVSNGILEVRVAFRVHGDTGQPLAISAQVDGYVHEKWAIFTDGEGNRIYIAGSLNESQTALIHNAENIDVHADWWGDIERQRVQEAEAAFETLWRDQNPHMRVLTLPEAVRQRLVHIGHHTKAPIEIDGTTAKPAAVEPPSAMERLRFAVIKDGPRMPGGRFVGMETVPIEPWPHQEIVARRIVETWPCSYLLCDEVGLGKTIEAGLAVRSLVLSGLARRVLIAPPASLTRQWQREMASKFFLSFARAVRGTGVQHETIFPVTAMADNKSIYDPDLCIVSTGLVSRRDRQGELQAADDFDIGLVDEAHYARRSNPRNGLRSHPQFGNLYRAVSERLREKTRCLLLATATPMQLDWIEVFDLLALTNRVGAFQFDPTLSWSYYHALGGLVRDTRIDESLWDLLRRSISSLKRHDPFLWGYLQEAVIDGRVRMAARKWLEQAIIPRGLDQRLIRRLIFAASPLSRVMLRHGRGLLEIYREKGQLRSNLARREIQSMPSIFLEGLEKKANDDLEDYCKELTQKIAANADGRKWRVSLGFYLSFLRLRLASSLFALKETLRRRREKVELTYRFMTENEAHIPKAEDLSLEIESEEEPDDRVLDYLLKERTPNDLFWEQQCLDGMLVSLADLSAMPLKLKELLKVLEKRRLPGHRIQQTVIFTRFFDTLQDMVQRLRKIDATLLIGTYSGQGGQYVDPRTHNLRGTERDEIKHRFLRGEIDVLICTDAAAEGLNLQTADLLINYDLPWNPMKVEQRIGRIDRIGQKHTRVYVLNLFYADSAEQIVYERLLHRLVQAGYIVGTQQISMLPIMRDEFNELAAKQLTAEELESRARERIEIQKRRTQSMEIPPDDLYEIYIRLQEQRSEKAAPVTIDAIWQALAESKHLRELGCTVFPDVGMKVMTLRGIASIEEGTMVTTDRQVYEAGLPSVEGRIHFASYGDPVFECILDAFDRHEQPDCFVRILEKVPENNVNVVAYAAAEVGADGTSTVRLIKSWQDLQSLKLDESANLAERDLSGVQKQLREAVQKEFNPTLAVARFEKENQRAGLAQRLLNLLILKHILVPPIADGLDNFWSIVRDVDKIIQERDQLMIPKLSVPTIAKIHKDLIFDIPIPNIGEEISPILPIHLVGSALDAGCRIADGMKVKKSALTVDAVKQRLGREIERRSKEYQALA